ncbi:hypothetical protein ACP4OV_026905 [Aristida adscensionis]
MIIRHNSSRSKFLVMDILIRHVMTSVVLSSLLYHTTLATTHGNCERSSRCTYIVHVRPPPNFSTDKSSMNLDNWYKSFLPPRMETSKPQSPFIYTYREAIFGFAVKLMKDEASYVKKKDGVLMVREDQTIPLLTTHTPDFLGLRPNGGAWKSLGMGEGSIIGIIDSGIDFAHRSFDDFGMASPPAKWRGSCNFTHVKCNKKVIGARSFLEGKSREPPLDRVGHGTHNASTATERSVEGVSVLGNGYGTAAGMAPHAHLAVYQVCGGVYCYETDILAEMEAAIADGVDIMSLSLGGHPQPFYLDSIALGAFSAMRKGIFVSCAAGNDGPGLSTLSNEAPWVLTVGARTMDRQMKAIVKLGDGRLFVGESAYQPSNLASLPLVYEGYDTADISGKIVARDAGTYIIDAGKSVKDSGGAGAILLGTKDTGHTTMAAAHVLPASYVNYPDGEVIKQYVSSTDNATASIIFNGTSLGITPALVVAFFSSRGPSKESPGILKPDIIGPGVNVIAAWPFNVGPETNVRNGMVFNSLWGTSMSTSHSVALQLLSGVRIQIGHLQQSSRQ